MGCILITLMAVHWALDYDQLVTNIWAKYYCPTPKWYLEKWLTRFLSRNRFRQTNLLACLCEFTKARMSLFVRYFSGAAIKAFDIRIKIVTTKAKQRLTQSIWCSKQITERSPVLVINRAFAMLLGTEERQRFSAPLRGPFKTSVSLHHCNVHELIIVVIKGAK